MESLRQYLLSIVAASIISALAVRITDNKGTYSAVVKLLVGIFLSITVISPITSIRITDFSTFIEDIESDTSDIIASGECWATSQRKDIIKTQTETYIVDKASSMGAELNVEVTLSDSNPSIPVSVEISGVIDPYSRQHLQNIIANDLGIAKENQNWS